MPLYLSLLLLLLWSGALSAAPVNINKADAATIAAALNGIGLNKARAIVEHRRKHGPFQTPDALMGVRGIGKTMINKNRRDILLK